MHGAGAWAWALLVSVLLATAAFLAGRESVPAAPDAAPATPTPEAPAAVDPEDLETLQDLVVAAVRDAKRAVDQLAADTMGPLAGGLGGGPGGGGLGLPGF